jgi:hypothetical protein
MNQSMRWRTRVSLLMIAACGAFACAEEEPQLCDGSDDVRWASHHTFGHEWVPPFIAEYGSSGIRIDGHCQFWLYDTSLRGLRRGVIGAVLERSIMYWSNYGSYARYDNPSFHDGCYDAGGGWVSDGTTTLGGCASPEAPSGLQRALGSASYVHGVLNDIADEYVWRPVQILPLANPNVLRNQPIYDWNAPFDLAAHAVTYAFDEALDRDITPIPVDDPAVLARLDELRIMDIEAEDAALRARSVERGLFVRDADGRIFQLFVRDEQPEGLFADPTRR